MLIHFLTGGEQQYNYPGENNKNAMIAFLKSPSPASVEKKPAEVPWSEEPSQVNHLTSATFDSFIAENPSVMVILLNYTNLDILSFFHNM